MSYLLMFLGTAKLLGVVAILVPGAGRLREWAFAGLIFELLGALNSGDFSRTAQRPSPRQVAAG
jgi:hypothetical protein